MKMQKHIYLEQTISWILIDFRKMIKFNDMFDSNRRGKIMVQVLKTNKCRLDRITKLI